MDDRDTSPADDALLDEDDAPDVPVENLTGRTKPRVRGRTESIKRLSKRALQNGTARADHALELIPEAERVRPETRGECLPGGRNAQRPCPFISCKYHLYLDVSPQSGAIKVNFPDLEVWEMRETCALDVADLGGVTLDEVGANMNLTRERIRQIETRSTARLRVITEMIGSGRYIAEPARMRTVNTLRTLGQEWSEDGLTLRTATDKLVAKARAARLKPDPDSRAPDGAGRTPEEPATALWDRCRAPLLRGLRVVYSRPEGERDPLCSRSARRARSRAQTSTNPAQRAGLSLPFLRGMSPRPTAQPGTVHLHSRAVTEDVGDALRDARLHGLVPLLAQNGLECEDDDTLPLDALLHGSADEDSGALAPPRAFEPVDDDEDEAQEA